MKKLLVLCLTLIIFTSFGQQDFATRKKHFNIDASGLALQGYDVVGYFNGKPAKGDSQYFLYYKGVKYLFANAQHLETFKAMPEKHEPNYGGWCAYAMGKTGEKVEVDPTKFKIVDGKLNLYYYSIINNTLTKWNENEAALKTSANQYWNQFTKQ
jgi:YHS domain-containing protein